MPASRGRHRGGKAPKYNEHSPDLIPPKTMERHRLEVLSVGEKGTGEWQELKSNCAENATQGKDARLETNLQHGLVSKKREGDGERDL